MAFSVPASIPSGLKWSEKAFHTAAAKHSFIYVSSSAKKTTRHTLSGAAKSWNSADPQKNQIVFSFDYRITGTPADIRTALQHAGIPEANIQQALARSVTAANHLTTMAGEVQAELSAAELARPASKKAGTSKAKYSQDDIIAAGKHVKDKETMVAPTPGTAAATRSSSVARVASARVGTGRGGARGPRAATLQAKYQKAIADGKVLDVTKYTGDMKDATAVKRGETSRARKLGVAELALVSENADNYARAVNDLYGSGAGAYAGAVSAVRQALAAKAGGAPVPGSRLASSPQLRAPTPTRR